MVLWGTLTLQAHLCKEEVKRFNSFTVQRQKTAEELERTGKEWKVKRPFQCPVAGMGGRAESSLTATDSLTDVAFAVLCIHCISWSNTQPTSVYWVMRFPISAVRNMSKAELEFLKAIKVMMRLFIAMENKPPIACNSFNETSEFLLTGIMAVGQIIRFLSQAAHRSYPAHLG